jgi:hypothetical protein
VCPRRVFCALSDLQKTLPLFGSQHPTRIDYSCTSRRQIACNTRRDSLPLKLIPKKNIASTIESPTGNPLRLHISSPQADL